VGGDVPECDGSAPSPQQVPGRLKHRRKTAVVRAPLLFDKATPDLLTVDSVTGAPCSNGERASEKRLTACTETRPQPGRAEALVAGTDCRNLEPNRDRQSPGPAPHQNPSQSLKPASGRRRDHPGKPPLALPRCSFFSASAGGVALGSAGPHPRRPRPQPLAEPAELFRRAVKNPGVT